MFKVELIDATSVRVTLSPEYMRKRNVHLTFEMPYVFTFDPEHNECTSVTCDSQKEDLGLLSDTQLESIEADAFGLANGVWFAHVENIDAWEA